LNSQNFRIALFAALQALRLQELLLERKKQPYGNEEELPENRQSYRERITHELEQSFLEIVESADIATTFEVGAHEASFSLEISSRRQDIDCYAFEANPVVYNKFRSTIEKKGVIYLNEAISNRDMQTVFSVPLKDDGKHAKKLGSLSKDNDFERFNRYTLQASKLDRFKENIAGNCALWIDVEGHAGEVIEGAAEILESCVAIYVEMETRQRWENQKTDVTIIEHLLQFGFVPIMRDIQRFNWQYNAVFVHHSILHQVTNNRILQKWNETVLLPEDHASEIA